MISIFHAISQIVPTTGRLIRLIEALTNLVTVLSDLMDILYHIWISWPG